MIDTLMCVFFGSQVMLEKMIFHAKSDLNFHLKNIPLTDDKKTSLIIQIKQIKQL